MKFKEFTDWCNERASDGCWSMQTAIACLDIMSTVRKSRRCRRSREKLWHEKYEAAVESSIVNPINAKIAAVYGDWK